MTERLTISEAAEAAGVHRNTVRNWVKSGKLDTARLEDTAGGEVWRIDRDELAAKGYLTEAAKQPPAPPPEASPAEVELTPPEPAQQEPEPPRWAMELLARSDARQEALLERLRQAEQERADAQRDSAIAEHKLETARADAAELRADRDRLRRQLETVTNTEPTQPATATEEPEPLETPAKDSHGIHDGFGQSERLGQTPEREEKAAEVKDSHDRYSWWKRAYTRIRRGN